jgi:uncharacterized protein HemX
MRKLILTVLGFLLGGVTAYLVTKRREELKRQVAVLQEKLKQKELSEKTRAKLEKMISKINENLKERKKKGVAQDLDEEMKNLAKIEEEIDKLREVIEAEVR